MKSFLSPNTNPDPTIIPKEFLGSSLLYWDVGFFELLQSKGLVK